MEISIKKIHKRVVEALDDELLKYGKFSKVVEELHLEYQRVYEIYRGRKGTKQLPADIISHLVYHLKYSPYWLLCGLGNKKKPLPK